MDSTTSVRLDKRVHEVVKEYSNITGVPIAKVLNNAITDWMETVGTARIEAMKMSRPKSITPVVEFPVALGAAAGSN